MSCECESDYEYHEFVECITSALDARDPYTGDHSRRVSDMACYLCGKLGLRHQMPTFTAKINSETFNSPAVFLIFLAKPFIS